MTTLPDSQPYSKLEVALEECRQAAQRGYDLARENLREVETVIAQASESISAHLISLENTPVHTTEMTGQLREQLSRFEANLHELQKKYHDRLETRRQRLDRFSITLFGRTMAGKSTLMEILTGGDGRSIGIGKQRTTRDVRAYIWKGLEITDVPGIAAFEGEQDEEVAFDAASQADLVLFLITNDGPQSSEVERLTRIRKQGKPVLGICNVKVELSNVDEMKLFLRELENEFASSRIHEILNQFHAFVDKYMPGTRIPFVGTHLRSRFLANQPGYEAYRERLLEASCFHQVEASIIEEVTGRGTFLRFKSFVDEPAVSISDLTDELFDFSARNAMQRRILMRKREQFHNWLQNFKSRAQERINNTLTNEIGWLRVKISSFAGDHYDNEHVDKEWESLVKSSNLEREIKKLQEELITECNKALSEIGRELNAELSLVARLTRGPQIKTEGVFDTKGALNIGAGLLGLGSIAARFALGSTPVGWVFLAGSTVVGLISLFSDEREKKVKEAKKRLQGQLYSDVNQRKTHYLRELNKWFEQNLQRPLEALLADLDRVIAATFTLADAQRHLAQSLNAQQKKLARILVEEAFDRLNAHGLSELVVDVARVPGFATMLVLQPEVIFPELAHRDLEKLLDEPVWFVTDTQSKFSMLTQTIGHNCNSRKISIIEKKRVAYAPLDELDDITRIRVKLAQQLTGLHVMKPSTKRSKMNDE
jgi:hypothetical protein